MSENDMNVSPELNLVSDDYVENINLAKQKNKLLFLSSTMIYRDEMKYLKSGLMQRSVTLILIMLDSIYGLASMGKL